MVATIFGDVQYTQVMGHFTTPEYTHLFVNFRCFFTDEIHRFIVLKIMLRNQESIPFSQSQPMTDPWCWYIYANMTGVPSGNLT